MTVADRPKRQPMKLTDFGQTACDELGRLNAFLWFTFSTLTTHNDQIKKRHPEMETPNADYARIVDRVLGEYGVCRTVDIYQWYNAQVLKTAVQHAPDILEGLRDGVRLSGKDISSLIKGAKPAEVIVEKVVFRDKTVRTHIHKTLGIWEEVEMSYLVELRNCIVHAFGHDEDGKVREALASITSKPEVLVTFQENRIELSRQAGQAAAAIGLRQISIMDQEIAHRYRLATTERKPESVGMVMG